MAARRTFEEFKELKKRGAEAFEELQEMNVEFTDALHEGEVRERELGKDPRTAHELVPYVTPVLRHPILYLSVRSSVSLIISPQPD